MSLVEIVSNLVWTIELSLRQFFSVFANLVDYKSLISIGELLVVAWAIGWMSRIGVKPKKVEIESVVKKTIRYARAPYRTTLKLQKTHHKSTSSTDYKSTFIKNNNKHPHTNGFREISV